MSERLLLLWVAVGPLEMLLHDVGNERRFVFLLPAMAAFTAIALSRRSLEFRKPSTLVGWLAAPLVFYCCYIAAALHELGRGRLGLTDAALERMANYPWPGNVAELKDVARRLVLSWKRKEPIDGPALEAVLPDTWDRYTSIDKPSALDFII